LTFLDLNSLEKNIFEKIEADPSDLYFPSYPLSKNAIDDAETQVEVSRHDHHSLEVKSYFETTANYLSAKTEMFVFFPKTFQIPSVSAGEIQQDLLSRVRLAIPLKKDQGRSALENAIHLAENTAEALKTLKLTETLEERIHQNLQEIGSILSETIKHFSSDHSRRLASAFSFFSTARNLKTETQGILDEVEWLQSMLQKIRRPLLEHQKGFQDILLLDEFLSHLLVQYLGRVRSTLEEAKTSKSDIENAEEVAKHLETRLKIFQKEEASHCKKFQKHSLRTTSWEDQNLLRLSHLKKFFQSHLFIDIHRVAAVKRFSESNAALGAAVAGLWMAFFQQYTNTGVNIFASGGLMVLCLGVIAYVVKDRIKEWSKQILNRRLLSWIPDNTYTLLANGKPFGKAKEWIKILKKQSVPSLMLQHRHRASLSHIENKLPEDVLILKKEQTFQAPWRWQKNKTNQWAVQESLRLNIERYLKHLDDRFKEVTLLDEEGQLQWLKSHRVYCIYLAVTTIVQEHQEYPYFFSWKKNTSATPQQACFRIFLDKKGIVKIEDSTGDLN